MSNEILAGSGWSRLWDVFHAVRAAPAPARSALLNELCGSDAQLRSEVEELLAADQEPGLPLDRSPVVMITPGGDDAHAQPGTVLCGRFEIVRLIGQGGMGSVYEAIDRSLGGRVALKTVSGPTSGNHDALRRFYREIDLARQVTHPNVCRIFDLFEHREESSGRTTAFVTMELLRGETLADRLRREPLTPAESLDFARQIAGALDAAHSRGIVHRDLKPGNIILTSDKRVVVTDFGLALRTGQSTSSGARLTRTGQFLGTPEYMAPEQLVDGEIGPATDLYAFGVVLHEMITGAVPFHADSPFNAAMKRLHEPAPSPRAITPAVDDRWERTILRCLERDPRDRFRSATEAIASLTGAGPVSRRPLRVRNPGRWITALVAVVLLALIASLLWRLPEPRRAPMSIVRMTNVGNAVGAALSPDGKFVAYALGDPGGLQSLWVRQVATGSTVQIVPAAPWRFRALAVSADGNYVYAMGRDLRVRAEGQGLYQIPILGGEPRRFLSHDGPPDFTLSPDGKHVAIRSDLRNGLYELIIVAIADGAKRTILQRPSTQSLFLPAWSPDGTRIAFGTAILSPTIERRIEEITIATGQTRTIRRVDWPYLASMAWLPDGEGLLVTAYEEEQPPQVWLVPAGGGEPTKLTNDVSAFYSASPSRDGAFASLRGEGSAHVVVLQSTADGRAEIVRKGVGNYFVLAGARMFSGIPQPLNRGGVRWAGPDRIIYSSASNGRRVLLVIGKDGGDPHPLTLQSAWSPEVTPDGRTIAFISDQSGTYQVWTCGTDGRNCRQRTFGGYVHAVTVAGDHIYYATSTGEQGLWRIPVTGGRPEIMRSRPVGRFVVSSDERWILRESGGAGRGLVLESRGEAETRTYAVPRYGPLTIFQFDAGGRSFSYIDWKDGVANLWRQKVEGGEPQQVTSFTRGQIYSFDWTRDGKWLTLAHGEPATDAVLVRNFR